MNRRLFISLATVSLLSGCTAWGIGWRKGGLCSNEASQVKVDYYNNSIDFLGVVRISRVRAETDYIDAIDRGFEPPNGSIIYGAIEESKSFIEFVRSGGFTIVNTDRSIEEYKKELCRRSCSPQVDDCKWSEDLEKELARLIVYARGE